MRGPVLPGDVLRFEARQLYGEDPVGYESGRPDYPERVYELLTTRCGLRPGRTAPPAGAIVRPTAENRVRAASGLRRHGRRLDGVSTTALTDTRTCSTGVRGHPARQARSIASPSAMKVLSEALSGTVMAPDRGWEGYHRWEGPDVDETVRRIAGTAGNVPNR